MPELYLFIVVLLFVLVISDLIVGVSFWSGTTTSGMGS